MWYRITLGAVDAAVTPVKVDQMVVQGSHLEELFGQVMNQVLYATDGTRQTRLPGLRGALHVGLQVEVWASSKSYVESGLAGEDCLRAIQTSAMLALSSGGSSPSPPTRTGPLGFPRN